MVVWAIYFSSLSSPLRLGWKKKNFKSLLLDVQEASDLPKWNFDGSSTNQASGTNSDVFLIPVALFDDPFRGKPNKMVLCDTYTFDDQPTCSNHRKTCLEVMNTEAVKVIISVSFQIRLLCHVDIFWNEWRDKPMLFLSSSNFLHPLRVCSSSCLLCVELSLHTDGNTSHPEILIR